jgi:hypothetical protein
MQLSGYDELLPDDAYLKIEGGQRYYLLIFKKNE